MLDWREVYPLPWEVEKESAFIIAGDGTSVVQPYYPSAAPEQVALLQAICDAMNNQGTLLEVDTREQRRFELFKMFLASTASSQIPNGRNLTHDQKAFVANQAALLLANAALKAFEAQEQPATTEVWYPFPDKNPRPSGNYYTHCSDEDGDILDYWDWSTYRWRQNHEAVKEFMLPAVSLTMAVPSKAQGENDGKD